MSKNDATSRFDWATTMSNPSTGNATPRRCALCGRMIEQLQPQLAPFCSERCKLIDLGKWLDENYGLPIESSGEDAGSSLDDPSQ